MNKTLTDVPGIQVGHYTDSQAATGCTVILSTSGAVAGIDVRGGAPGTRDVALLDPVCTVEQVHAIVLSGGSAFGLAAADGVMRWLEEKNVGFATGFAKIPIVPTAILFDLAIGSEKIRPTGANGYSACLDANSGPVVEGSVGAGTGATVGKFMGPTHTTKGGIGTSSTKLDNGIVIGALVAVNAVGDVIDPSNQQIIAGARTSDGKRFADSMSLLKQRAGLAYTNRPNINQLNANQPEGKTSAQNTTIGVIATNAKLTKPGATKVAQMAHDGLARTIRPIHTASDGDTIFALSTSESPHQVDAGVIGAIAADVMADAVLRAVYTATSLHGIPSVQELAEK